MVQNTGMLLGAFVSQLNQLVPPLLAESWDNVGFQVGDGQRKVFRALVVVDVTKETIQEALDRDAQLILSHHPAIFNPLKSVVCQREGHLIYQLIKKNLAIYVAHTNLDVALGGVADSLAMALGLREIEPLVDSSSNEEFLFLFYLAKTDASPVKAELKELEKGQKIRDWTALEMGKLERFEGRVSTVHLRKLKKFLGKFPLHLSLIPTKIRGKEGLGRVGILPQKILGKELIQKIKKILSIENLRYAGPLSIQIEKVALLPGSGGGYLHRAVSSGATAFITADLKHHTALEAEEMGLLAIDPDHYPSESLAIAGWAKMIRQICPEVEIIESQISTNPFRYA